LPPYGLAGGQNGLTGKNELVKKNKRIKLKGKLVFDAETNDLLVIKTPGGGGWGRAT
jgi:N-methylhydantoinase B/oxoprolinase/acetone carboxylase alpha subunit